HHLANLGGVGLRQRSAEHGEVLGERIDDAAVDAAVAADHAVARNDLLRHSEIDTAVRDELVDFLEGAVIEQARHALARGQLALRMLSLEALFPAAQLGEALAILQPLDRIHQPATQGFESVPTPSTLTIMRSPGVSGPTPDGVPVVIRSPGFSVMKRVTCSMRYGTGKINSRVLECWRRSLLTQPSTPSCDGSRPTATHGPIGLNVSKPLAREYCTSLACSSRAVT